MMKALQKLIEELEGDASLHEPNKLRQRIEALDRLDAFNLEVSALVADSTEAATYHCAKALQAQLEARNLEVYEAIRRDIQQGHGSTSLLQWLPKSGAGEDVLAIMNGAGYDYLDDLIVERAVLEFMVRARNLHEIQFVNGLKPGQLTAALNGEPVGTIIYNERHQNGAEK